MVNILNTDKELSKIWYTGQHKSCTLVIPKELAKEYDLDKPTYVLLERTNNGILISRLVLDNQRVDPLTENDSKNVNSPDLRLVNTKSSESLRRGV